MLDPNVEGINIVTVISPRFLIVVDESIGNNVNVEVLPYADMVVSSLSKVFSGDSNVMGGR